MYSRNKIIKNLILVVGILIVLIILLCSLGDITKIWNIITNNTKPWHLLLCLGVVLLYAFFNQLSLVMLVKHKYKDISFLDCYYISGSEFFFNAITPFSSGGQPFQAYALKRKNVKLSDSTSCLLLNFLAYQIVLNLFCAICIILYYNRLKAQVDNIVWLVIVGFSINLLVMILIVLIGTTKFMGKLLSKLMDLLCKIKFINKFIGNKKESFDTYVIEMQEAFREINRSKLLWLGCVITKVISLFLYYCIPYFAFICIGINLGIDNLFYVIAITSFSLTVTIWLPTPGSSGGAELAFTTFFTGLINADDKKNLALSGMLIWRFFTYYLLIFYGFLMYVLFERGNKDENRSVY